MRRHAGCAGGRAGYFAVRSAASWRNRGRMERGLREGTIARLTPVFSDLDLERVRIVEGASLPPNWVPRWVPGSLRADAMTFGYRIYFRHQCCEVRPAMALLIHELVHVDQVRRRGDDESRFACDYGRGYLTGGSYRDNPLEIEAYDFESVFARSQA
jgi:hypothetical protein